MKAEVVGNVWQISRGVIIMNEVEKVKVRSQDGRTVTVESDPDSTDIWITVHDTRGEIPSTRRYHA